MTGKVQYEVGDKIEIYRNHSNVYVNGGYMEMDPFQAIIVKVGPDYSYFIAEASYKRKLRVERTGRIETPLSTYYTRRV